MEHVTDHTLLHAITSIDHRGGTGLDLAISSDVEKAPFPGVRGMAVQWRARPKPKQGFSPKNGVVHPMNLNSGGVLAQETSPGVSTSVEKQEPAEKFPFPVRGRPWEVVEPTRESPKSQETRRIDVHELAVLRDAAGGMSTTPDNYLPRQMRRTERGDSSERSTLRKTEPPRYSKYANAASAPATTQDHFLSSSSQAMIEDSETGMHDDDNDNEDARAAAQLMREGAKFIDNIQFGPLPPFTLEAPPEQEMVPKAFTDWAPPEIPLNFDKIRAAWERNLEEFRADHAAYAADQLERARIHNQKAEKGYITERAEANARAIRRSNHAWYNAPAISSSMPTAKTPNTFTFSLKMCQKNASVTRLYANMTSLHAEEAANIPHFRTYYPIRRSQLVQSERDLLVWPEATEGDVYSESDIETELKGQFHFRMVTRPTEVAYLQIGRQWQPYAEAFLRDLNLTEEDMLRFILDDSHDEHVKVALSEVKYLKGEVPPLYLLKQIRRQLVQAPQSRTIRERMEALAAEENEKGNFEQLKRLKFQYLGLAFYAVSSYYRYLANQLCFNFMYCLKASPTLDIAKFLDHPSHKKDVMEKPRYSAATHFDYACRICHVYPCYVHGLESIWDYQAPDLHTNEDDSDHSGQPSVEDELCPIFDTLTSIHRQTLGRRPVQASSKRCRPPKDIEFSERTLYGDPNSKGITRVFFPCNHLGPCEVGICHCVDREEGNSSQQHYCEKSCGCDPSCRLRFKGCKCARKGKICSDESKCACLRAGRECDPDLCGVCGVYEVLDPQNHNIEDIAFFKDRCQNCQIQRNIPKRTLIGESTTHGIGLFSGEDIKKGEYIGEYLGAKLNWKQAERSGLYFLFNGYSYLFDMTGDQTVDAMVLGNKQRFINSIPNKWNCAPRVLMCNTEHRMGLFATKDVAAGEELSFNYGDPFFHNHAIQAKRKAEREKQKTTAGVKKNARGSNKKRIKTKDMEKAEMPATPRTKRSASTIRKMVDEVLSEASLRTSTTPDLQSSAERMSVETDDEMDYDFVDRDEMVEDSGEEPDSDDSRTRPLQFVSRTRRGQRR
ncbi:uncharacterized protein PV09_02222 [Verruconis gallopava]|uniref:SET domain-containing protein n=1 Tax=Verruconis gallopava TaxID=253628 RepID=A0A0D2AKK8_9PEZI|nr:uncharacterized protein PV09_02222 [Verruconis gallopava]KIW07378.1 hypothetical protein PV09_02222 [Verruconis gallopava]